MTRRRDFLRWLGASSLLASVALPEQAEAEALDTPVGPLERMPISATWDMSWFDRMKGKQVGVFDSPDFSEGAALWRAIAWRDQVAEVYGTPASDMAPVVVFRHNGIPAVMNHEFWSNYGLGKELKIKDPATKKWTLKNSLGPADAGATPQASKYTIPNFIATGGIVLACNLAFNVCVSKIREKDKLDREAAVAKAKSMLIPGVILQPSGFFAVMKAQETGGGFMVAS